MTMDDRGWYSVLGLEPGASPERVKQAYRDMVQVWHPDRFEHNPRLRRKAQDKLKEINKAYEMLNSHGAGPGDRIAKRYPRTYRGAQRRTLFRVDYPLQYRPTILIDGREYNVVNVSERGVKFRCEGDIEWEETVQGIVTFYDGESLDVEGKVVRHGENEAALKLVKRIPFQRIINEQRFLINKLWLYKT
jgi:hypothetical protein